MAAVVDASHSPPRNKGLALVPAAEPAGGGTGRDSGIEDGRQSNVSSIMDNSYYTRAALSQKVGTINRGAS